MDRLVERTIFSFFLLVFSILISIIWNEDMFIWALSFILFISALLILKSNYINDEKKFKQLSIISFLNKFTLKRFFIIFIIVAIINYIGINYIDINIFVYVIIMSCILLGSISLTVFLKYYFQLIDYSIKSKSNLSC